MRHASLTTIAVFALLSVTGVHARDIVVDVNAGSDSNSGSSSAPLKTIQAGVDAAAAGDRVIVKPGTYTETFTRSGIAQKGIHVRKVASQSSPITIMAETAGSAILDQKGGGVGFEIMGASDVTISGFVIRNAYGGGIRAEEGVPSTRITIENNLIQHVDGQAGDNIGGAYIGGCAYCIVRRNKIDDIKVGGVLNLNGAGVHGYDQSYCTIENNEISNAYIGIYHKRSAGVKGLIVRRNIITNVNRGVFYGVAGNVSDPPHVDQEVYENFISANEAGVIAIVYETIGQSHGLTIRNNIFTGSGDGIYNKGFANTTIQDNIFYNLGGDTIDHDSGTWKTDLVSVSNNLYTPRVSIWLQRYVSGTQHFTDLSSFLSYTGFNSTNRLADPLFVNFANRDWHLQSGSPAKGAAHDGRDIGAYPTGSGTLGIDGALFVSPQAPASLTVN